MSILRLVPLKNLPRSPPPMLKNMALVHLSVLQMWALVCSGNHSFKTMITFVFYLTLDYSAYPLEMHCAKELPEVKRVLYSLHCPTW